MIINPAELTKSDLSVSGQQHVAGLEVAVDHAVLVQEVECFAHLVADAAYLRLGEWLLQLLHDAVHCSSTTELDVHLSRHVNTYTCLHRRRLHSAVRGDFIVPPARTVCYGTCSFSVAGPSMWNALPASLHNDKLSAMSFQRQLKAELYIRAFYSHQHAHDCFYCKCG